VLIIGTDGTPHINVSVHTGTNSVEWILAIVAILSLLFVAWTALATSKAAKAAATAAEAAVKQVQASFPELDIESKWVRANTQAPAGRIKYLYGLVPARDVVVWVRGPGGLYRDQRPLLTPAESAVDYRATLWSGDVNADPSAFFQFPATAAPSDAWVGVTWLWPDGQRRRRGYKMVSGKVVGPAIE
jgi:hypothetical protein